MYVETLLAVFAGIAIGIFTGLTPGIHVNLVCATLYAISGFLLKTFQPISLASFIVSLSVTHSFLDTIPSIYLGAPENENALAVLPGQKMLLQGEGYQAVKITILGTYSGMLFALILVPLFIWIAGRLYPLLKPYLLPLLIAIIAYMILRDENRIWNLLMFSLSGTLGITVFSLQTMNEPLFPLLSGLFGTSGLLISFFENTSIPLQKISDTIDIKWKELIKALAGSALGVFLIQFFPGMGPAQGAVLASQVIRDMKDRMYLALVGAMGTMSVIFSLVTFYVLDKAKDGSIVVISKLIEIDAMTLILLLLCMLISGSIAIHLVLFFARVFSSIISRINYRATVITIICFVIIMCIIINGIIGLLVLFTATCVGLIAPLKGIGRNHAMGALILPVIFYLIL